MLDKPGMVKSGLPYNKTKLEFLIEVEDTGIAMYTSGVHIAQLEQQGLT